MVILLIVALSLSFLVFSTLLILVNYGNEMQKKSIINVGLYVFNDKMGDIVDLFLGSHYQIKWKRMIVGLPALFPKKCPSWINVSNQVIGGIKVRVYEPKELKSDAVCIYIHGGGFAVMEPEYYDDVLFPIIKELKCVFVSIGYSKTPENKYPTQVNQCFTVCDTILNGDALSEYNIDRKKAIIMGDSAGACLAAVMVQKTIKLNCQRFIGQCLIYPCTNMIDYQTLSHQEFDTYSHKSKSFLTPQNMARYGVLYMGGNATKELLHFMNSNGHIREELFAHEEFKKVYNMEYMPEEYMKNYKRKTFSVKLSPDFEKIKEEAMVLFLQDDFSPLLADQKIFKEMPKTFILSAQYDILRDDSIMYAHKLKLSGGDVSHKNYARAEHGCLNLPFNKHKALMSTDIVHFMNELLTNN